MTQEARAWATASPLIWDTEEYKASGCNYLTQNCEKLLCEQDPMREGCDDLGSGEGTGDDGEGTGDDGMGSGSTDTASPEELERIRRTLGGTSSGDSAEPGGSFDLNNPACRALADMGLGNGRGEAFWDDFFGRQPGRDPRRERPHPDDVDHKPGQTGLKCADSGQGEGAHCQSVALCTDGTTLDPTTCTCTRSLAMVDVTPACASIRCPEGTSPVPVGGQACVCQADDQGEEPGPPPSPFDANVGDGGPPGQDPGRPGRPGGP